MAAIIPGVSYVLWLIKHTISLQIWPHLKKLSKPGIFYYVKTLCLITKNNDIFTQDDPRCPKAGSFILSR
jgi:hypothetical protein